MSEKNAKQNKVEVNGSVKFNLSTGKTVDLTFDEYQELQSIISASESRSRVFISRDLFAPLLW